MEKSTKHKIPLKAQKLRAKIYQRKWQKNDFKVKKGNSDNIKLKFVATK